MFNEEFPRSPTNLPTFGSMRTAPLNLRDQVREVISNRHVMSVRLDSSVESHCPDFGRHGAYTQPKELVLAAVERVSSAARNMD